MDLLDFAMKYEDSAPVWKRKAARAAAILCQKRADHIEKRLNRQKMEYPDDPDTRERIRQKVLAEVIQSQKNLENAD